ncbi:MAG: hypothetical protein LiPW41_813 [Parcubacteria group bacterium LiPW_41]|nr:MAG: hypothetical protein LiPW41_813 [Parcubacteria group bacterium LiPW_41]
MHITDAKLKELLLASEVVTEEAFLRAQEESFRSGQSLINVLIGRGDITEDYLGELLEPYFSVPIINLLGVVIPKDIIELIPETYAKTNSIVAYEFDKTKKIVRVATTDPKNYEVIEYLRAKLGMWIEVHFTTSQSLRFALKQYKKQIGGTFAKVVSENVENFLSISGTADLAKLAETVSITSILDAILNHAVSLNASDIHFEPLAKKEILVRFRVDGVLQEVLSLNEIIEPILVARVKILANLQIDEHRIPQDGRFKFETEIGSGIDVRVNVMPVMYGEKVEMRLLKNSARPLSLEDLGLSEGATKIFEEQIQKPHGMILVTGPTGHGKTTTLYAVLQILNTSKVNITTIEDPIEYSVPGINQTQVNVKAGVTFANGLRALLRQNPDIIMIGEIRDDETVEISVHAALTGHLVLSSLHTNDATSAIPRLIDMHAAPFLLSSTINVVVAQRLVRKICTSCVESYKVSKEVQTMMSEQIKSIKGKKAKVPTSLYRGKGCGVCAGSGFAGQIGVFEIFPISDAIRPLIIKNAPSSEIRNVAIKEGMVTMFEDGLKKAQQGITSIEEVFRTISE